MSVTNRVILLLKTPVNGVGAGSKGPISAIVAYPNLDNQSPLSGLNIGVDLGVSFSNLRYCVNKDNIAGYIYETEAGALDALITQSVENTPGFFNPPY